MNRDLIRFPAGVLAFGTLLWLIGCNRQAAVSNTPAASTPPAALSATEARVILNDAASSPGAAPESGLELALFDIKLNEVPRAESELVQLCSRFPRFARGFYHLGMLELRTGRTDEGLGHLKTAAAIAKDDAEIQTAAAIACLKGEHASEAKAYADAAIKLDPTLPDAYLVMGRVYSTHGTALQGIEYIRKFLELSPNPAQGFYLMGLLYSRQGNKEESEKWMQQAVNAAPDNPECVLALGRVYFDLFRSTRTNEAIACFQKAIQINPKYWLAHSVYGRALISMNKLPEGIAELEEARKLSPQPGPLYYDIGQAQIRLGKREEGRKSLELYSAYREYTSGAEKKLAAINASPKDRRKRYDLARFCMSHGQYRGAIATLKQAEHELGPDSTLAQLLSQAEAAQSTATAAQLSTPGNTMPVVPLSSQLFQGDPGGR